MKTKRGTQVLHISLMLPDIVCFAWKIDIPSFGIPARSPQSRGFSSTRFFGARPVSAAALSRECLGWDIG